uniref:2-succinyl-6-hydroxy-2, 4-cyclohexadiene-1-carboxylate synthase n=1 Tax=Candidatus Methanophaga sp. ANME-1 ERB7 TaxID=2759913 RepID=A0A7G9Z891_9EURY|nr:2-succinyl-6-hydroxy-2,4-cyclohexadiene-1-carboxylate synthase [Methanosarcinales archaeon ANME-1 ERB7]
MSDKIELVHKDIKIEISSEFRTGDAESIMFIPGLGCSKDSFYDVWKSPGFERYTILTFDLLGFGDSSKPKAFSYSMEDHAEICKLIIEKLCLEKIHLVGHSMGGAIGLLLIEKVPSRILSFTNLEGNLIGEDCTFSREAIRYTVEEFEAKIFKDFESRIKGTKDFNRQYHRWLSESDPYAFYRNSESLVQGSDSRELLKRFTGLEIKKWYVFGEANKNLPILKMLDDVPKIEIAHAGHFMMLDNPEEFYRELFNVLGNSQ